MLTPQELTTSDLVSEMLELERYLDFHGDYDADAQLARLAALQVEYNTRL